VLTRCACLFLFLAIFPGKKSLGFLNGFLYKNPHCFADITSGSNLYGCVCVCLCVEGCGGGGGVVGVGVGGVGGVDEGWGGGLKKGGGGREGGREDGVELC